MRAQGRTEMKPYESDRLGPRPLVRPDTNEAVRLCVNAWHQLDADRQVSFSGTLAIPYTAIVMWAEVNGLDRQALEIVWSVIHHLDNERTVRLESERKLKKGKR